MANAAAPGSGAPSGATVIVPAAVRSVAAPSSSGSSDSGEQVHAHQVGGVGGSWRAPDLIGRALLGEPTGLHDGDTVRQGEGVERVVGHEHDDPVEPVGDLAQQRPDLPAGGDVHAGEGFVQQQQPGVGGERASQRDAPPFPTGELPWLRGRPHPGGEPLEEFAGAGACGCLGRAARPKAERHVLQDRQVGEQQVVLEAHADPASLGRELVDAFAVELDRGALGGFDEARERFDHGGLAGAVGSQEREGLAVVRLEHGAHVEGAAGDGEVGPQSHVSAPS